MDRNIFCPYHLTPSCTDTCNRPGLRKFWASSWSWIPSWFLDDAPPRSSVLHHPGTVDCMFRQQNSTKVSITFTLLAAWSSHDCPTQPLQVNSVHSLHFPHSHSCVSTDRCVPWHHTVTHCIPDTCSNAMLWGPSSLTTWVHSLEFMVKGKNNPRKLTSDLQTHITAEPPALHTCVCMHIHTQRDTYNTHMCIHIHMSTQTYKCIHTPNISWQEDMYFIDTQRYIYTHKDICTHIYKYTYMHTHA